MTNDERFDPSCPRVTQLPNTNCFICSNKMEIILRGKGLWEYVSPSSNTATSYSKETTSTVKKPQVSSKLGSQKDLALAYIIMSISASC